MQFIFPFTPFLAPHWASNVWLLVNSFLTHVDSGGVQSSQGCIDPIVIEFPNDVLYKAVWTRNIAHVALECLDTPFRALLSYINTTQTPVSQITCSPLPAPPTPPPPPTEVVAPVIVEVLSLLGPPAEEEKSQSTLDLPPISPRPAPTPVAVPMASPTINVASEVVAPATPKAPEASPAPVTSMQIFFPRPIRAFATATITAPTPIPTPITTRMPTPNAPEAGSAVVPSPIPIVCPRPIRAFATAPTVEEEDRAGIIASMSAPTPTPSSAPSLTPLPSPATTLAPAPAPTQEPAPLQPTPTIASGPRRRTSRWGPPSITPTHPQPFVPVDPPAAVAPASAPLFRPLSALSTPHPLSLRPNHSHPRSPPRPPRPPSPLAKIAAHRAAIVGSRSRSYPTLTSRTSTSPAARTCPGHPHRCCIDYNRSSTPHAEYYHLFNAVAEYARVESYPIARNGLWLVGGRKEGDGDI
ncbi:hypothetical protein DXG03_002271 [Asterophora parasitica]|uniref:Uncharacterized protein n=1 Tax=Asterophora parasitica TaxID=117018 RepID=A0A9P7G433_9AGAR|nr:hypothetical protein DXG03_002271 [Asterophora parasitica]